MSRTPKVLARAFCIVQLQAASRVGGNAAEDPDPPRSCSSGSRLVRAGGRWVDLLAHGPQRGSFRGQKLGILQGFTPENEQSE